MKKFLKYHMAVLFLILGLAACQRNDNAGQGNAQIVAAAEAAAQAAEAAAQAAETASQNAEAAAQAAEEAGTTAASAAAPAAPAAAPAAPAGGETAAAGEPSSVPAGGDGENAAQEGDEAQNAAPADGGDSPQAPAAEGEAAAGGAAAAGAGDPAAGQALFTGSLGCYGCHGQAGGGGMGPSLADANWIYGGDEASITETLVNGRPGGMPAFGGQASEEDIANVVAYVMSLGGATGGGAAEGGEAEAAAPAEGGEAAAAAPAEGGDAHAATGTPEQVAAAQSGPIEGAQPPDNAPVTGEQGGGSALAYATAAVGQGTGYTHPNGMGADWADDGQAEPVEGPAEPEEAEGDEAQNAAPEDGGDSPQAEAEGGDAHAATGTEEQVAAAQSGPIEGAQPPDNAPVTGQQGGGAALNYGTANVGQGEGYTHPNGIGSDWADDGQAEPVEGAPAGEEAPAEGEEGAAAPAEGGEAAAAGEPSSVPAGGDGENAAQEGDEAQNAAPADGGDSPQAAAGGASAGGEAPPGDAANGKTLFTGSLGCYGCHGQAGGGGMGPSLADKTWIYGGDVASITETLVNGRPGGMPAFGGQASEEDIADVVAYVISLGGATGGSAAAGGEAAAGEPSSVPAGGDGENAAQEGDEAQNAAPADGGDSPQAAEGGDAHAATGTEEQIAAAQSGPIEGAQPPDNAPVTGEQGGGSALAYATAAVGQSTGYTHPNGMGADWADDGQAEPVEGPPLPEAETQENEAQNAAGEDGGDAHAATGTPEQQAAAQSGPIEGAQPPDNAPVAGTEGGGSALNFETANVGQGEGYTHPNGIGSDWADDGQAEPVEGAPAGGEEAPAEGEEGAEGEPSSVPAGGDGENAAEEGDEAQNAAPEDGGDSPQAAEGGDAHEVNASEEELAAAAAAPIEGSQPPDNAPVTGEQGGGTSLAYEAAGIGQTAGYTHPNGMGNDWADDGQAEPVEGPALPEEETQENDAQNAAPEDGGDAHAATGTEEQVAAAQSAPIEGAQPPDNAPVAGTEGGGSALNFETANVGQGEGYTHPNGFGSDWATENQNAN